jgi:hypothetical protein
MMQRLLYCHECLNDALAVISSNRALLVEYVSFRGLREPGHPHAVERVGAGLGLVDQVVVGTAAVAFVNYDEVEEVGRVLAEVRRAAGPAHEGLEDREEHAAVLRHAAPSADLVGRDTHQGARRTVLERREGVVGLVGQDVAVSQDDLKPVVRSVPDGGCASGRPRYCKTIVVLMGATDSYPELAVTV